MGWVSPNNYSDGSGHWTTEANVYDEDTETFAWNSGSGNLVLMLASAIDCDKVRIFSSNVPTTVTISVFYEGEYHEIFSGSIAEGEWVEKTIPAGTKSVTQAIVSFDTNYEYLNEFDFNEYEEAPPTGVPLQMMHYMRMRRE